MKKCLKTTHIFHPAKSARTKLGQCRHIFMTSRTQAEKEKWKSRSEKKKKENPWNEILKLLLQLFSFFSMSHIAHFSEWIWRDKTLKARKFGTILTLIRRERAIQWNRITIMTAIKILYGCECAANFPILQLTEQKGPGLQFDGNDDGHRHRFSSCESYTFCCLNDKWTKSVNITYTDISSPAKQKPKTENFTVLLLCHPIDTGRVGDIFIKIETNEYV